LLLLLLWILLLLLLLLMMMMMTTLMILLQMLILLMRRWGTRSQHCPCRSSCSRRHRSGALQRPLRGRAGPCSRRAPAQTRAPP
jgi:hypothetical protein